MCAVYLHSPRPVKGYQKNKLKKERASALRKLNTRLSRLEEEIEQAEEKTVMLEESLSANPPYEELLEITKQLEEITAKRDALYEEWEQVSEELTSLSD